MNKRIAITGGIACGKSLFAQALRELGMAVLDADDVTHELEAPGGAAVAGLVALAGPEILKPDGGIDRQALGQRVFADATLRDQVNGLLHPLVRQHLQAWIAAPGKRLKAVVIPLLFEAGWQDEWDIIICLVSSEARQIERMMQARGLSEAEARLRIAAQMPVADKAVRSHCVIENEADATALARQAAKIYCCLMEKQA